MYFLKLFKPDCVIFTVAEYVLDDSYFDYESYAKYKNQTEGIEFS